MQFEVVQDRLNPQAWRVEAIDYDQDGQVYVCIFSGPLAQQRAEEYAIWKNESVLIRKAS